MTKTERRQKSEKGLDLGAAGTGEAEPPISTGLSFIPDVVRLLWRACDAMR